jgi:hypothetical protein
MTINSYRFHPPAFEGGLPADRVKLYFANLPQPPLQNFVILLPLYFYLFLQVLSISLDPSQVFQFLG